jgi:hypothetical protein
MEILNTKKATERLLLSITPSVPTGFEGVDFDPPVNALYQRCQFRIDPPTDPVFPAGYHRENMQMQVFIAGIKGQGTGEVIARAELLRQTFYKGLTLIEGTTRIHILETAQIGSVFTAQDRVVLPVLISLIAEVYQ